MKTIAQTTLVAALLGSLAATSMASLIFSDDFSDGNRDGWYRYAQTADSSLAVNNGRMELTSTASGTDFANNFSAVRPFDAVDMSVAGTKITLQLDFVTLQEQLLNRGIGLGLYNSNGSDITGDTSNGTVGNDDWGLNDSGWYTYVRRNSYLHRMYNTSGGILDWGGSNRANDDNANLRVGGVAGTGFHVMGVTNDPEIWYTYRLEVEALDVGGNIHHAVTATFLQGATVLSTMNFTDTTGTLVGNIDQVGVLSMGGNDFAIDNLSVTVVPEPGTISLLLIGAGLIAGLRRRTLSK